MPEAVGVPLIVTTFEAQLPVTPAGNPLNVAPVAPVVAYVMALIDEVIQIAWLFVPAAEVSIMVLFGVTLIVPVALTVPQPPVNGML